MLTVFLIDAETTLTSTRTVFTDSQLMKVERGERKSGGGALASASVVQLTDNITVCRKQR